MRISARCLLALGLSVSVLSALADASASAAARDGVAKNETDHVVTHVGQSGAVWPDDYGVRAGLCNRAAISAALEAAGDGSDTRPVAIVLGSTKAALINASVRRDLDEADRACIGHTLELGENGRTVRWRSDGVNYTLTPGKATGRLCRSFALRGETAGRSVISKGSACRRDDGAWVPRG